LDVEDTSAVVGSKITSTASCIDEKSKEIAGTAIKTGKEELKKVDHSEEKADYSVITGKISFDKTVDATSTIKYGVKASSSDVDSKK